MEAKSILKQKQTWESLGRVDVDHTGLPPNSGHATYPVALVLDTQTVRVFFSTRTPDQHSYSTFVDLVISGKNFKIIRQATECVLSPDKDNQFEQHGTTLSSIILQDEILYAFYLGWNVTAPKEFENSICVATSTDMGETFTKVISQPLIGKSPQNPVNVDYPFVFRANNEWRMLYGSVIRWKPELRSVLKSARSDNLVDWQPLDDVLLTPDGPDDLAISRASVLKTECGYKMWFACRSQHYRLGFATSADGISWARDDSKIQFKGTRAAWESTDRTYPCVFRTGDNTYMLYNGNHFGKAGFGLAILAGDD